MEIKTVQKRDGSLVAYDKNKIRVAIKKANGQLERIDQITDREVDELTDIAEAGIRNECPGVEDIQESVIRAIVKKGYVELAKVYIIYRHDRDKVRGVSKGVKESIVALVNGSNKDVMEENSNKNATVASTQRDLIAGEVSKDMTMRDLLPRKIVNAHKDGVLHFHDADYFIQPIFNCCLVNIKDAENSEEMFDIIRENINFFYDEDSFNHDVKVNLLIDCGNVNCDYTCDNVLNYCGNGEIDEHSSILWLARQQGKEKELREAVSMFMESGGEDESSDPFVKSCITEWNNFSSSMGTLTFLTSMRLFDLLDLIGVQNKIKKNENKHDSDFIEISKNAVCGLFDPINGGGSVLEIELDKDVKIPIKNLKICPEGCHMAGYDVNEVYGLVDYAWGDCYK